MAFITVLKGTKRPHAMAPGALAIALRMPSGVRTCCTQRGQGTCIPTPRVQLGSRERYRVST